jgi:hypothetical protein
MVDKAFLVGVDDLQELCRELKNYSLRVNPGGVTITQHDGANGLNNISFIFPIVANLSILRAIRKKPESGLQACLHVRGHFHLGAPPSSNRTLPPRSAWAMAALISPSG